MKKILSAGLAALMALSMTTAAFATEVTPAPAPKTLETGNKTFAITALSGQPVYDTGAQISSVASIGTPNDAVSPNQAIYFTLPTDLANFLGSSSNYRATFKKITNSKLIKSVKIVEKKLDTAANNIYVPNKVITSSSTAADYDTFYGNGRNTYVEVVLNDTTSADEFKIQFSVIITAKKALGEFAYGKVSTNAKFANLAIGNTLTLNGTLYVSNQNVSGGDNSITVGSKGVTIKPIGNDDNEVIFETDDTMATLKYRANSNPAKFYASLSTKWTSDLLTKFKNTDAVIRKFSPATVDATSRATLSLNNPFGDDVSPKKVAIYSVSSKGTLTDVTKNFTYDSDDDTFTTRTRTLGTCIISDVKIRNK